MLPPGGDSGEIKGNQEIRVCGTKMVLLVSDILNIMRTEIPGHFIDTVF